MADAILFKEPDARNVVVNSSVKLHLGPVLCIERPSTNRVDSKFDVHPHSRRGIAFAGGLTRDNDCGVSSLKTNLESSAMSTTSHTALWLFATAYVFLIIGVFSDSETMAGNLNCKEVYTSKYLTGELHKAMATSGGKLPSSSINMQCGWARGYGSKQKAIEIALNDCRKADRNYKNRGDCKIVYAE
jgi:hypothetical protein